MKEEISPEKVAAFYRENGQMFKPMLRLNLGRLFFLRLQESLKQF